VQQLWYCWFSLIWGFWNDRFKFLASHLSLWSQRCPLFPQTAISFLVWYFIFSFVCHDLTSKRCTKVIAIWVALPLNTCVCRFQRVWRIKWKQHLSCMIVYAQPVSTGTVGRSVEIILIIERFPSFLFVYLCFIFRYLDHGWCFIETQSF
jgi:hypothetical protein